MKSNKQVISVSRRENNKLSVFKTEDKALLSLTRDELQDLSRQEIGASRLMIDRNVFSKTVGEIDKLKRLKSSRSNGVNKTFNSLHALKYLAQ